MRGGLKREFTVLVACDDIETRLIPTFRPAIYSVVADGNFSESLRASNVPGEKVDSRTQAKTTGFILNLEDLESAPFL